MLKQVRVITALGQTNALLAISLVALVLAVSGCDSGIGGESPDPLREEKGTMVASPSLPQPDPGGNAGLTASRGSVEDAVALEWPPVPYATGYKVFRSNNYSGPYLPIAVCGASGDAVSFLDKSVKLGVYYWYKVRPVYAYVVIGRSSKRVQGWSRMKMVDRVDKAELVGNIVSALPHFYNVRGLAGDCLEILPEPVNIDGLIPASGEIFEYVKGICATPHRRIGSPEGIRGEEYIISTLGGILGPENVYTEPVSCDVYNAVDYGLEIDDGGQKRSFDCFYTVNTGITYDNPYGGSVTGGMVWAGTGSPGEFDDLGDISGRIVAADCEFPDMPAGLLEFLHDGFYYTSDPTGILDLSYSLVLTFARGNLPPEYTEENYEDSVYWQAYERGAAGLVLVMKNHPGDTNTHWGPYDGKMRPIPCLYVSDYLGGEIRELAGAGAQATVTLRGTIGPGTSRNIYGILPGVSDETIMVSTHHDAGHKGATEDGTGVAMVMSMAEGWAKLPCEERRKTMLFVFATGHLYAGKGAREFSELHAGDLLKNVIIDVNLEHLAAKNVVDDGEGNFVFDSEMALSILFVNEDPVAIATSMRMLANHMPESTCLLQSTLLGPVPPGEAGHYHIASGINFIHWISTPYYLLTAEDTLDKVDIGKLNPLARAVSEIIGGYMALPDGFSYYE